MFDFQYHIKNLPEKPGVYIMKNSKGEIIYIGKAKILKNRVSQYFRSQKNSPEKVKAMVKNISEFEYIITDSEMEALILECNLIKKHRPRYNILLKDDKHYPFIKITINEDFPRVFVSRMRVRDGAKYFGPYPSQGAVYETLELIKKIFPIRTCRRVIKEDGPETRPCLNYYINLCKAPCAKKISKEDYKEIIKSIMDLLTGKDNNIIKELEINMNKAAEELDFEKAAEFRDKIAAIEKIRESQKIILSNFDNEDFINIYSEGNITCAQIFFVREGKIIGNEHFIIENILELDEEEIIDNFIKEFYSGTAFIPKNIYVPFLKETDLLEEWLSAKRKAKVGIKIPQMGDKKKLLNMVGINAKNTFNNFKLKLLKEKHQGESVLLELSKLVNLENLPERIEAYDISNIQGVDSVGTMVVFEGGKPKNSDYRRFKIKSVKGADDYQSMYEILHRRFKRGIDEINLIQNKELDFTNGKFSVFPDLILMDGGKGQVNIALEVLKSLNISIPVCGMVKDDKHKTKALVYNNREIEIKSNKEIYKFITRIQDEVHRFAITYHRSLRDKRVLHSVLEDIPNIGAVRRKELLKKFGSIDNIKKAKFEELIATESINEVAAKSILDFFHKNK
ncbi:excinuclease ABC subunit UvrC [Clostridium grantii]|uniref:UvrABC system protein C n=1 Tax=Clostridium grantii DSM 8605 TaxID=1121316 RepID=A0A1M5U5N3_9CLOT|nr:excinuclease ABC subunit UvrC [Clostridium grantii]SHH58238.1 Excinuclease ABC subunit C [Clostridium grantii DSM 8605]